MAIILQFILAKEGMELMGDSQSTFSDMVSELGLAAVMGPKTEYTILAPNNNAFTSKLILHKVSQAPEKTFTQQKCVLIS